jgi:hypothetical protein
LRRVSQDYVAIKAGRCEICQRQILSGMYVFDCELRSGRQGVAHSLCEPELKKTEEGRENRNHRAGVSGV